PTLTSSERQDILGGMAIAERELQVAQQDYQIRCVTHPVRPIIRILMVICDDGFHSASFGDDPPDHDSFFGMSFLVSTLAQYRGIMLQVTRKHRRPDPAHAIPPADENFRFSTASLTPFDQLWIFGFCVSDPFTADERDAVARFMNGGGGV